MNIFFPGGNMHPGYLGIMKWIMVEYLPRGELRGISHPWAQQCVHTQRDRRILCVLEVRILGLKVGD